MILPVQIRIPASASPGDHFAGIAVGLLTKITGNGNTKQNLNLEQRVIARMQFRIGGDVHAVLSVTGLKARYHNNWNPIGQGSATVTYDIRNTGNVVLSGSQRLTVSGLMGASGSVPPLAAIPLLLPGGTAHVTVTIRHVTPALLLHAKVRVTPIPALGAYDPGIHGGSASVGFWAIPWLLLVAIGAILGGTIWGIIRSRGPRRRYSGERRFSDEPALAGKA